MSDPENGSTFEAEHSPSFASRAAGTGVVFMIGAGAGIIITAEVDSSINGPLSRYEDRQLRGYTTSTNKPFFEHDAQIELFGGIILSGLLALGALKTYLKSKTFG